MYAHFFNFVVFVAVLWSNYEVKANFFVFDDSLLVFIRMISISIIATLIILGQQCA
jgi:hypothetical protein